MSRVSLRNTLRIAAPIVIYDESHGVFGELISPDILLDALSFEQNVGCLDDPTAAQAVTSLHSITYSGGQFPIEIDNLCSLQQIRVRWMDEQGKNPPTHVWTIEPSSSFVQYTIPGHLFLLSVVVGNDEWLLGAYRPLRALSSGLPHFLLIQQRQEQQVDDSFLLEVMLGDSKDSLMVASSALDPVVFLDKKTVPMLLTIVKNVIHEPSKEKYHKLRLSNRTIQRHIVPSWGAIHLLYTLGFRENEISLSESKESLEDAETYLELPYAAPTDEQLALFRRAQELLELLVTRADPHFVAELAPPTPWQTPLLSTGGALASHWNTRGTHFITPDERWERTDELRRWRGARPRPPPPGDAPSSRGRWGR